jgi:hypothetical protein
MNGESDERDDIDVEGLLRVLLRADRAQGHNKVRVFQEEIFGRQALTEHYSQTKSLLVSYSDHALGLF